MILINNGTNPFSCNGFVLPKGKRMEVPDAIAEEFLKIDGVEKYIAPEEIEKAAKTANAKAEAKIKTLKDENKKLKEKIEDLEKAAKEAKKQNN